MPDKTVPNTTYNQRRVYNHSDAGFYRQNFPRTIPVPGLVAEFINEIFENGKQDYQKIIDSSNRTLLGEIVPNSKDVRNEQQTLTDYKYEKLFESLQQNDKLAKLWDYYKTALTLDKQNQIRNSIFGNNTPKQIVQDLLVAHMAFDKKLRDEYETEFGEIVLPQEAPITVSSGGGAAAVYTLESSLSGAGDPTEYEERVLTVTAKLDGNPTLYTGPFKLTLPTPETGLLVVDDVFVTEHPDVMTNGTQDVNIRLSKSGSNTVKALAQGLGVELNIAITVIDKATPQMEFDWELSATCTSNIDIGGVGIDFASCGTGI